MFEISTLDPVSKKLDFTSKTGGTEIKIYESRDESRILSVSEEKKLVTEVIGTKKSTVSSEVIESEVSTLEYFKLISVLSFYSATWFKFFRVRSGIEIFRMLRFFPEEIAVLEANTKNITYDEQEKHFDECFHRHFMSNSFQLDSMSM